MTKPRFQLDTGAIFLRLALAFFLLREVFVWLLFIRRVKKRLGGRLWWFLVHNSATPRSILYALLFALVATTLLHLLVRLVLEPLVRAWHTPWSDGSAGLFHVAANERVIATSPGRRAMGRRWMPGTLVRTNLRLWFFPRAHDAEIWSEPLDSLHAIQLEPGPRIAWGYIRGWPERLSLQVAAEGQGGGGHEAFATPDPSAVLAWFNRTDASPQAAAPPVSSPRSL
jgi:hypothetical protein